jgi:hypothetical protein
MRSDGLGYGVGGSPAAGMPLGSPQEAPVACSDPELFFFENVPANSTYTVTVEGPVGQFTVDAVFTNGLHPHDPPVAFAVPPGTHDLPSTPGGAHVVSLRFFFARACAVTVAASAGPSSYCRSFTAGAGAAPVLSHVVRMIS